MYYKAAVKENKEVLSVLVWKHLQDVLLKQGQRSVCVCLKNVPRIN